MPDPDSAHYDFVIAGGGLAGACAAVHLGRYGRVLVLEKESPASGASGVAVGLVNPILGRRARPVRRIDEALPALEETIALSGADGVFVRRPTLRPAGDDEQVERFRRSARRYPEHCTWLARSPHDWLRAPRGVLRIETGGAVDVDAFVRAMLSRVDVRTQAPVETWKEYENRIEVGGFLARYLILAVGRGFTAFPELMRLRLHQVKGQIVRLSRPADLPAEAPHVAGSGYVAHDAAQDDAVFCGSTYEHRFADLQPSASATEVILRKVEKMLPSIREACVLEERAGVRITVPGIRLPMVGPLPGRKRVWVFSGLGAKGLLTGPLVAKELPRYLEDPERIPKEMRVRLAKGR